MLPAVHKPAKFPIWRPGEVFALQHRFCATATLLVKTCKLLPGEAGAAMAAMAPPNAIHKDEEMAQSKQDIDSLIINIKKYVQQQKPQHQTLKVKMVEIIYQDQQQPTPQSQSLWQQLQMKSNNITIKMIDIYVAEEKFQQSVINEMEGQIITQDAEYTKDKETLDQEQVLVDIVSKFDTFRGGTEFNLFNASTIILSDSDSKVMDNVWSTKSKSISGQWSEVSRQHER